MNKLLAVLFLLSSFSSFAAITGDASLLKNAERGIDNICADTWCEGDFNWNHENLQCDFSIGTCTMDLTLISYLEASTMDEVSAIYKQMARVEGFYFDRNEGEVSLNYAKKCVVKGMNSIQDVIGSDNSSEYSEGLYDSVLDCVTEMENFYYRLETL